MSRVIRLSWAKNANAPSRAEGRACEYEAYLPDRLVGRQVMAASQPKLPTQRPPSLG